MIAPAAPAGVAAGAEVAGVAALRRAARLRAAQRARPPFDGEIADAVLAGSRIRSYVPDALTGTPATYFFLHGGYGVFGDLELQDGFCRLLSAGVGRTVVAVEYPLAPEHTFDEAIDAVVAVLRDAAPGIAVLCGDSAGGALAVAVAAADAQRSARLDGLLLTNPNLDLTFASFDDTGVDGPDAALSRQAFSWWTRGYVGAQRLDETAHCLPPVFIAASSDDSLLAEAKSLRDACAQEGTSCCYTEFAAGHGIVANEQFVGRLVREARIFFDRALAPHHGPGEPGGPPRPDQSNTISVAPSRSSR